jgi:4-hydroxybenzoate polyprenyltransferase
MLQSNRHGKEPFVALYHAGAAGKARLTAGEALIVSATRGLLASNGLLKALHEEFLHGGHVTALMAPAVILAFGTMKNDPVNPPFLAICYLIPLIVYSFDYYREMDGDRLTNPERSAYLARKKKLYPFLMGTYATLLVALIVLCEKQLSLLGLIIGILVAGGVMYPLFMKRLTRLIPGFKTFYVSGEWALATALMYVLYAGKGLEAFSPLIFFVSLANSLGSTIFYDLKDIRSDSMEGLKTIPAVLGRDRTMKLLYGLDVLSMALLLAGIWTGELGSIALVLLAFLPISLHYLRKAGLSGEDGLVMTDYVFLDCQFLLWPVILVTSTLLVGLTGPLPLAVPLVLLAVYAVKDLFRFVRMKRVAPEKVGAR